MRAASLEMHKVVWRIEISFGDASLGRSRKFFAVPAYACHCPLRYAVRSAMLVASTATSVRGATTSTRMSESSSQRKSDQTRQHAIDGESSDAASDETVSAAADIPDHDFQWPAPVTADERFYPPLKLDAARYEAMLADFDMSEEERVALVEAMWNIVVCFVDLGFDLHPLQQIATAAEQDTKNEFD